MKLRVRSIFAKIVVWFVATVALSLIGFLCTSILLSEQLTGRDSIAARVNTIFLDDARSAYEEGGASQLASYLERLDTHADSRHFLTDARGIDLITGEDRSELSREAQGPSVRRVFPSWLTYQLGPTVRVRTSDDRRYQLITVVAPATEFELWNSLRYFLWLPILIGGLCYLLAVHLATPLRHLRRVVERFGYGELGLRFHSSRKDEIGELARAFNRMADQITTLLSAERRLLQDVSHELRSPLARLGFAIELAKTSNDREAALARIRKEGDRLNQLVDELLQLTRAEGDPKARNMVDVELGELLEKVVSDCVVEAEARGCLLVSRVEENAFLIGDRELLRRAYENVVRNAIRHAPEGSRVAVTLTTNDGVATIAVRDEGPGVPPDALAEIFKPFYRVENDRNRSSGGMGLGLSIASRAVELHKGRMTARNGQPGLIVEIQLPTDRTEQ